MDPADFDRDQIADFLEEHGSPGMAEFYRNDGWVLVTDRLPPYNKMVNIYTITGNVMTMAEFRPIDGAGPRFGIWYAHGIEVDCVIAWKPPIDPPRVIQLIRIDRVIHEGIMTDSQARMIRDRISGETTP